MHVILLKDINAGLANYLEYQPDDPAAVVLTTSRTYPARPLWKYHGIYRLWYSTVALTTGNNSQLSLANDQVGARGVVVPIERVSFDRHLPLR